MNRTSALLLTLCFATIAPVSVAQVGTSAIVGNVTDSTGAMMGGVPITVTDMATGSARSATTDSSGGYVVDHVQPGQYSILATKPGFKEKRITGVLVLVDQRVRIDFTMDVGSTSQQVEVQAQTPLLETDTATVGKVIESQDIVDLPLNGRNFLQLATLTPGVQTYVGPNSSSFANTGGTISANGMSAWSNTPMIDGIYNQDTGYSRMNFSPSIDMIQEFKIQTNTYDAEYGMAGGAQINIITKRGSNIYHGSVYEFLRNNVLDARPFFQPGALPHFSRNQFGGTFGGRIPKLKGDFFFFSYEGLRSNQGLTYVLTVPTAAIKSGDFSATGSTIYDPATYNPATGQRQPFPGDVIPADRISPQAKYFLQYYPAPQTGGFTNNYVSNPVQTTSYNDVSFRWDHEFSEKDSIMVRYSRKYTSQTLPNGDCGCTTPLPGFGEHDSVWGNNYKIGWTHVFNPSALNSFYLGFSQYYEIRKNQDEGINYFAEAGIEGVAPELQTSGFPNQQISGWTPLSDSFVSGVNSPQNNYIIGDTFTKIKGKHSFKIGGEWILDDAPLKFNLFTNGIVSYNPVYTTAFPNAPGDQFTAFADFLLGVPDSSILALKQLQLNLREQWFSLYFQDTWNITKDLTLNLGLRFEGFEPPYDTGNRITSFYTKTQQWIYPGSVPTDPAVPTNSETAAAAGLPRAIQAPTTYNWAPRVGFAWRPLGNDKTVLRGGFGIFYNWVVTDLTTIQGIGVVPFDPLSSINCNSDIPCLTSQAPYSTTAVTSTGGSAVAGGNTRAYTLQYSLGIQREIIPTMSLEVGYVGNKGIHNWFTYNFNQPSPGPGDIASRSPFPAYGGLSGPVTWGSSNFNALQLHVRKTYDAFGLSLLGSYSWGHGLGNAVSGTEFEETLPYRNYNDGQWRNDYGNTSYDVRNTVSIGWVYDLPWGRGKRWASDVSPVLNQFIGGWKFGGIYSYISGLYFTANDVNNVSNAGGTRPDTLCNPNNFHHANTNAAINEWFNTSCFTDPPLYTFGNTGTNTIRAPSLSNFDLSLYKLFSITESKHLEFRTEFFNAFNKPNFGAPGLDFGTGDFGVISTSLPGREIQFGLRFDF
jgi:hypothetical protein